MEHGDLHRDIGQERFMVALKWLRWFALPLGDF